MSEKKEELPPPSLGRSILNLLPLILVTLYLCTNSPNKRPDFKLKACGKNLHTIGVELEKSRLLSDDKLYPKSLEEVYGKNKPLPKCPEGGQESYLEGYQVSPDRTSYLLVCKGDHHKDAEVPPDYPRIGFSVQEASGSGHDDAKIEAAPAEPEATSSPQATPTPKVESTPEQEEAKEQGQKQKQKQKQGQDQNQEGQKQEPQAQSTPVGIATPEPDGGSEG